MNRPAFRFGLTLIGFLCTHVAFYIAGYNHGVADTHRDAVENGLMKIERVGERRVYRWIETHKLGYED